MGTKWKGRNIEGVELEEVCGTFREGCGREKFWIWRGKKRNEMEET